MSKETIKSNINLSRAVWAEVRRIAVRDGVRAEAVVEGPLRRALGEGGREAAVGREPPPPGRGAG